MENYTDDMFNNLKLCKRCPRPRWRYFPDSDRCETFQSKGKVILYMGKEKDGETPCRLNTVKGKNIL